MSPCFRSKLEVWERYWYQPLYVVGLQNSKRVFKNGTKKDRFNTRLLDYNLEKLPKKL